MRKFYPLLTALFFTAVSVAQTVQIGTGAEVPAATIYSPVYRFSATSTTTGSRSNILFTATEMATAGIPSGAQITKVEFYKANAASFVTPATHQMLMANTSNTSLAATLTWASIQSTHAQVFTSTSFNVPAAIGWVEWNIPSFIYTGGAFEIATETSMVGNGGTDGPFQWQYTTGFADKIVGVASATGATLNGTVTAYKHRPNIRITYIAGSCITPPTPGNAISSIGTNAVCAGTNVSLSLENNSAGFGQTYQWQSSATQNGTYNNVSAELTATSFSVNPTTTTWYRAALRCNNGTPVFSVPVQVLINPPLAAGTYTINNALPASATNSTSLLEALQRFSCGASGPIVFEVAAGQVFTGPVALTNLGSATNTIIFRKSGTGANPKIQALGTSTTTEAVLTLTGCDYITFDGIDIEQTGSAAADWVEYGIAIYNASATNGSQNNTFKNGVITMSNAHTASRAIFMDDVVTPTTVSGTNSFNRFLNMKIQSGFTGYYISGATSTYPDQGNEIKTENGGSSIIQNLGNGTIAANMYGVYGTYQTGFVLRNTQMNNFTNTGTSLIYGVGLVSQTTATATVSDNQFSNFSGGGTVNAIYFSAGAVVTISNNIIHSLTTSGNTGAIRGIDLSGSEMYSKVSGNRIYNISSSGTTSTTAAGIEIATGTEHRVYNNMISDIRASSSTSTAGGVKGISVAGGVLRTVHRIYHNTIFLNDVAAVPAYSSAGIYISSSTPTVDLRNNIVVNKTNASAGRRNVALWKAGVALNFDSASNNNLYYAGNPSGNNYIYFNGTDSLQTIEGFKSFAGLWPRETQSITDDFQYLPIATGIIKPDPNATQPAESAGTLTVAVATDFEGTPRGPYPLGAQVNGGGVKPDLGADEFDGRYQDVQGPEIIYTALPNTANTTASRTIVATITDVNGVATANGRSPRLYYRVAGSSNYLEDASPMISGNTYTFTINTTALGPLAPGNSVEYYVAAQDVQANLSTAPFGGTGTAPPGSIAPPNPNIYKIVFARTGVYTVGASGQFQKLTQVAADLSTDNVEITGNLVYEMLPDYDGTTGETFPINFVPFNSNNPLWTVTIRPAAGAVGLVTSGIPGTSAPLINLDNVDRLVFDGRPGGTGTAKEWTFRNRRSAATIASVFRFINGATNDTLRHLRIESLNGSTTQAAVLFSTTQIGATGNSYNQIANNSIGARTDTVALRIYNGVLSSGTEEALNIRNSIVSNEIMNAVSSGVTVGATGNGTGWAISGNQIYNDSSTIAYNGILLASSTTTDAEINNNTIGGNASGATGTMVNSSASGVVGINVADGKANVTGNTIANIKAITTNTAAAAVTRGINVASILSGASISNNTIYNLSTTSARVGIAFGEQTIAGIVSAPNGVFVNNNFIGNTIYNISIENTSALTSSNIAAGAALYNLQTGLFSNNRIYNIRNKSTGTTANQPPMAVGVWAASLNNGRIANNMISLGEGENTNTRFAGIMQVGTGVGNTHNYYFNSVTITGTAGGPLGSFGFVRGLDTSTIQNQVSLFRNNIFQVSRSGGGSVNYAIGNRGAAGGWNSNNNVLFNTDGSRIGLWSNGTGYNFANWQTTTAGDVASQSFAVSFANPVTADLHLTFTSNGDQRLAGTPVAGITTDFDLQLRATDRPYMGADEGGITLPVRLEYFKGVRQNNVHLLTWRGQCTGDNNLFVIERSANSRDFTEIGEIRADRQDCGFVLNFTDRTPLTGINYYRLRIRDEAGRTTHSLVVAVLNKESGFELVNVYPTLTTGSLTLAITATRPTTLNLTVVDGQGKVVKRLSKPVSSGSGTINLDFDSFAAGNYLLQASTPDGYSGIKRFTKQ